MCTKIPKLSLTIIAIITSGCHCQIDSRNYEQTPNLVKTVVISSLDNDRFLTQAIYKHLHLNGINLIEKDLCHNNTLLQVNKLTISKHTTSIFPDGSIAEYKIAMLIDAKISIPDYGIYPINIKVCRSFFNNNQTVLQKIIAQQFAINEMYNRVAENLVHKILNIRVAEKKVKNKLNIIN